MKHLKNLVLVAISISLIGVACTKDTTTTETTFVGNWNKKTVSGFDGTVRSGAACFVIGNKAYVAGGYDGTSRNNELWVFDGTTGKGTWTQKAFMTGAIKRNLASAFAIGSKGYIVGGACDANLGYNGRLNDVWEYDEASDTWMAKTNLPDVNTVVGSGARYSAIGFAINNKGYISTGFNGGYTKDIYEFDPTGMGTWKALPSMPSSDKRQGASVLVNGNFAYIFGGSNNGTTVNDMYKFDPSIAANPWTQLNDITNTSTADFDDKYTSITRTNGAAFIVNGKGYYTSGINGSMNPTTWEYNFGTDRWNQKTSFERSARMDAIGFTVNGRGFVGLGSNSTLYFDNVDEFFPDATYDSNN